MNTVGSSKQGKKVKLQKVMELLVQDLMLPAHLIPYRDVLTNLSLQIRDPLLSVKRLL